MWGAPGRHGGGERGGRPKTPADAAPARLPRAPPEPRAALHPPTHQDALTSSSSQSLRAWYWNRGRPPAPPPPPPRSRGPAAGAWAPRGLGPAPSSSGPWPPRRRLASGGAGKDREVLILPVNLWYSEAIGLRARSRRPSPGRFSLGFSLSGSRSPPAAGGPGDEDGEEGEERTAAAQPLLPRATLKSPLGDGRAQPPPPPPPAARRGRGLGVCSLPLFCSALQLLAAATHGLITATERRANTTTKTT